MISEVRFFRQTHIENDASMPVQKRLAIFCLPCAARLFLRRSKSVPGEDLDIVAVGGRTST